MEVGHGIGWCTHAVTGQVVPYATADGFPAWSRERKSTSGSSGAEAGSRTVTGDSSSVGGSGEVGLPLEGQAFTSYLRPRPCASPDRGGAVDGGRTLLAPGQEVWAEVSGGAQFPIGRGFLPSSLKRPRSLVECSDEVTQGASSRSASPSYVEEEELGAPPEVVTGEGLDALPINPSALVPVVDLARLSPEDLATHLGDVARRDAAMPPSSPRLRAVLEEYGVGLHECGPNPPFTLCRAAHCVDGAAFGRKTPRVLNACVAAWHTISSAEALARSVSRKFLAEEQGGYPPAPPSAAGSVASTMALAEPPPLVLDGAWSEILPVRPRRGKALPRSDLLGPLGQSSKLTSSKEIESNERYIAGAQLLAMLPGFIHHDLVSMSQCRGVGEGYAAPEGVPPPVAFRRLLSRLGLWGAPRPDSASRLAGSQPDGALLRGIAALARGVGRAAHAFRQGRAGEVERRLAGGILCSVLATGGPRVGRGARWVLGPESGRRRLPFGCRAFLRDRSTGGIGLAEGLQPPALAAS